MVEIITQWPGHAAEEVERLVTVPIETEMNGVERVKVVRSISLYGLSDIRMTFLDGTDHYFARQRVLEHLPDATLPTGVSAGIAPLFAPVRTRVPLRGRQPRPLGDGAEGHQRLDHHQGVQERAGRRRHGEPRRADDAVPGAGRSDEARRRRARRSPTCRDALGANNSNSGGGFYSEGGQFYYVRGLALVSTTTDIAQHRHHHAERHSGAGEGHRHRRDRLRAAARAVRVQRPRRRRRRRDPDAHRRAGADGAQARRGQDEGTQRSHPAEGREDPPVLRPDAT